MKEIACDKDVAGLEGDDQRKCNNQPANQHKRGGEIEGEVIGGGADREGGVRGGGGIRGIGIGGEEESKEEEESEVVEESEEEKNHPERDSSKIEREVAMQQPNSLKEVQDKRTVAQQKRGGAIEWQRTQQPGKRANMVWVVFILQFWFIIIYKFLHEKRKNFLKALTKQKKLIHRPVTRLG